jgi:hypothetical protein
VCSSDLVERTVDGVARRFVERMVSHRWDAVEDSCYMDCAVSGEFDPPQSEFTGLWHLEGRTDVVGIIDGMAVTGLTVTNGTLTLPDTYPAVSKASFGIPYQADIKTLPVRVNTQAFGSNVARAQQAGDIALILADTSTIEAGIDEDHLFPVKQRVDEAYGDPSDLMDGEYEFPSDNMAGDDVEVHVRSSVPLPMTVLGIAVDPVVNG